MTNSNYKPIAPLVDALISHVEDQKYKLAEHCHAGVDESVKELNDLRNCVAVPPEDVAAMLKLVALFGNPWGFGQDDIALFGRVLDEEQQEHGFYESTQAALRALFNSRFSELPKHIKDAASGGRSDANGF